MASASSYLDKVFREPSYIWKAGIAQTRVIESSIESDQAHRLQWLAGSGPSNHQPRHASDENNKLTSSAPPIAPNPARSDSEPKQTVSDSKNSIVDQSPPKPGAARNSVVPLLSLVWNGAEPQNYQAQFGIGTEPVPFLLDLDTGSSLLWVQARLADTDPSIHDQSQYNPKSSRTSKDIDQTQKVNYGDGDSVLANIYSDNVSIGNLLAHNQQVGAVQSVNLSIKATEAKSNGLIGLGFTPGDTGLVQTLQKQGAIRYASISLVGPRNDPSKAAEIDAKQVMEPRGYLIVGSVDEKYYTGQIAWCPQISNMDTVVAKRWMVKLDAVILNGTKIFQDQYALIDTGTAYILTSPSTFTKFRKAVGRGARPTKDYMFAYLKDSIKTLSFVLGGRHIDLYPADISLGDLPPDAEGAIRSLSSVCTVPEGNWLFPDNLWILGGIFIDNVVTIFDYGTKRVGFADISEQDLRSEVGVKA